MWQSGSSLDFPEKVLNLTRRSLLAVAVVPVGEGGPPVPDPVGDSTNDGVVGVDGAPDALGGVADVDGNCVALLVSNSSLSCSNCNYLLAKTSSGMTFLTLSKFFVRLTSAATGLSKSNAPSNC